MKKILTALFLPIILLSCTSLEEAGKVLRNEKIKSTDEFLVKKKEPLVLPPDFNEIPEPGSLSKKEEESEDRIKKILKAPSTNDTKENNSSSVEDTIIDRIRK